MVALEQMADGQTFCNVFAAMRSAVVNPSVNQPIDVFRKPRGCRLKVGDMQALAEGASLPLNKRS